MKHLLNNISEEEKNSIREQHTGGMKISTDKFKKLLESKLGDLKPLVSEQSTIQSSPQKPTFSNDDENLKGLSDTPDGGKMFNSDFGGTEILYPNGKTKSGKCWKSLKDGIVVTDCGSIGNVSEQTESIPSSINDLRDLEEKTVNFYSDKENNNLLQNFSPSTIKLFTKNSKGELVMEYWLPNKGGQNSGLKKVIFDCKGQNFITSSEDGGNPNFKMYVNKELTSFIFKEFCNSYQKNDADKVVPKADFASTNGKDTSNMA